MSVFLAGVGAQFYRGIGNDLQLVGPFSRVNFFIGPNNTGKSILLNLLAERVTEIGQRQYPIKINATEQFRGKTSGNFRVLLGFDIEALSKTLVRLYSNSFGQRISRKSGLSLNDDLIDILHRVSLNGVVWLDQTSDQESIYPEVEFERANGWNVDWSYLWEVMTSQGGGNANRHWIPETLKSISRNLRPNLPPIHIVPAKRTLGRKGEDFDDLSGRGLIDHLAALQNPDWDKQDRREAFDRINRFLREVTGKPEATLEVPSDREHLLVHMDNKVLPLASLGTGIHEVVLIAAFCTIHDGSMMCIEEPEIHLHPLLQRKLIRYLQENTSSQYFIATHSAAFIDTPGSNIFHVSNDGIQTRVRAVLTDQARRETLDDLGYQASDLLQTNAVVWVEGPSDRIYVNHWIGAIAPELREGVHYTIMFYGGSLIRHLSASDEVLKEFIALRKLNRNVAILLDSDKSEADDDLKPHAKRILEEMDDEDGLVWITQGREIENYVDGGKLQAALKAVHPKLYLKAGKTGQFEHAFYFFREDPKRPGHHKTFKEGDKVGAANIVCSEEADLSHLDLEEKVLELVDMLKRANGMAEQD